MMKRAWGGASGAVAVHSRRDVWEGVGARCIVGEDRIEDRGIVDVGINRHARLAALAVEADDSVVMNSPKPVLCLADRSHNLLTYGEEAIRRVRLEPPVFHWHVGHE